MTRTAYAPWSHRLVGLGLLAAALAALVDSFVGLWPFQGYVVTIGVAGPLLGAAMLAGILPGRRLAGFTCLTIGASAWIVWGNLEFWRLPLVWDILPVSWILAEVGVGAVTIDRQGRLPPASSRKRFPAVNRGVPERQA